MSSSSSASLLPDEIIGVGSLGAFHRKGGRVTGSSHDRGSDREELGPGTRSSLDWGAVRERLVFLLDPTILFHDPRFSISLKMSTGCRDSP